MSHKEKTRILLVCLGRIRKGVFHGKHRAFLTIFHYALTSKSSRVPIQRRARRRIAPSSLPFDALASLVC